MLQSGRQSQFVEADGPKMEDEISKSTVNVVAIRDDRARPLTQRSGICRATIPNAHRIELDDIEVLAKLVMELACERFALGLLQHDILLRESAIVSESTVELSLRHASASDLPLGLLIPPRREPGQRGSENQQHNRELIELSCSQGGALKRRSSSATLKCAQRSAAATVAAATRPASRQGGAGARSAEREANSVKVVRSTTSLARGFRLTSW